MACKHKKKWHTRIFGTNYCLTEKVRTCKCRLDGSKCGKRRKRGKG